MSNVFLSARFHSKNVKIFSLFKDSISWIEQHGVSFRLILRQQITARKGSLTILLILIATIQMIAQNAIKESAYPFALEENEQVLDTKIISGKNIAFLVKYNSKSRYTRLKAVVYSLQKEDVVENISIDSVRINPWQHNPLKGKVRQSFENAIISGQKSDTHIHLEYQYQVRYSPDEKTILCYRYDYSQPSLYAQVFIWDVSLNKTQRLQLPIDDSMINHAIYINNKRELFILNTDAEDGIQLIRYQPGSDTSTLLEIAASSTRRNSFIPYFLNDTIIYVANICENDGKLSGIMYSRFNFEKVRVESVQFHPISKTMYEKISVLSTKGNYDLISFQIDKLQQVSIELEKRNIAANDYTYNPYAVHDITQWKIRKMQVQTGDKLIFKFDSTGKLLSEKVIE